MHHILFIPTITTPPSRDTTLSIGHKFPRVYVSCGLLGVLSLVVARLPHQGFAAEDFPETS